MWSTFLLSILFLLSSPANLPPRENENKRGRQTCRDITHTQNRRPHQAPIPMNPLYYLSSKTRKAEAAAAAAGRRGRSISGRRLGPVPSITQRFQINGSARLSDITSSGVSPPSAVTDCYSPTPSDLHLSSPLSLAFPLSLSLSLSFYLFIHLSIT